MTQEIYGFWHKVRSCLLFLEVIVDILSHCQLIKALGFFLTTVLITRIKRNITLPTSLTTKIVPAMTKVDE
jgi:hypothetical protein